MPVPIPPTGPTTQPPRPDRNTGQVSYAETMNNWIAWFASFWVYLVDLVPWITSRANETEAWANQASNAANTASSAANAELWVSGTTYALGVSVIDPVDLFTYRRRVAGAGTTRPGLDSTTWLQMGTASLTANNTFTGVQTFSGGIAGVQLGKNLLINPLFSINQRGYVSGTATTTANQYTIDRWRVVTSGQNITWTSNGNRLIVTAPAGGVEQVVEGNNIFGGSYVLNWTGTATATVNGTPRTKGEVFTLIGGVNATVRFIGGTVDIPQLERGVVATVIEDRFGGYEFGLCQPYYETGNYVENYYWTSGWGASKSDHVTFKVTKRDIPIIGGTFSGAGWSGTWSAGVVTANGFNFSNDATENTGAFSSVANWTAAAEL